MTLIVGLTGGIGCGKSSVSQFFSELGMTVIDTDVIAHNLTQSDSPAIPTIRKCFGDHFITSTGMLDRNKMRELVFNDDSARTTLEKILHPLILEEVNLLLKQTDSPYVILVIPLLFETKDYQQIVDRILVVDCDEQQQIARVMARSHLSEQQVRAIIATQTPRINRLQYANDIIVNNQDINYLRMQILHLHHEYMLLAQTHCNPSHECN